MWALYLLPFTLLLYAFLWEETLYDVTTSIDTIPYHTIPIVRLVVVGDDPENGGVIGVLDDEVQTVLGEQGV